MGKTLAFVALLVVVSAYVIFSRADVSSGLNIAAEAPGFQLTALDGSTIRLSDYRGKTVVLEWFNANCPFVKKHYEGSEAPLPKLQKEATEKGMVWLTISSTNPEHRDFLTPEKAKDVSERWGMKSTAMLNDVEGVVGKAYGAKVTPTVYVLNSEGRLVYQGAVVDQNSPEKNYAQIALEAIEAGKPIAIPETRPYGCSVKY